MIGRFFCLALLSLALLHPCALAEAADALPAGLLQWWDAQYASPLGDDADYIAFALPDGTERAFLMGEGSFSLHGFVREREGGWVHVSSESLMAGCRDIAFARHASTRVRPDGSMYPDDLGFDSVDRTSGAYLAYHYDGRQFSICEWCDPQNDGVYVMVRGTSLEYYAGTSSVPAAVVDAGEHLHDWIRDWDRLPATPQQAQALAAITRPQIAHLFEGYTLRCYTHNGRSTNAGFSRIEDGWLHFKYVTLQPGAVISSELDLLPVPLSASLLQRLETEPFDSLINPFYGGSRFLTENALDTARLPVTGKVLATDAQSKSVVLLTEDERHNRRVQVFEPTADGRLRLTVQTPTLPADTVLDLYHRSDGEIIFEWNGQQQQAGYTRAADGTWYLDWVMTGLCNYSVRYGGLVLEGDRLLLGQLKNGTLGEADLPSLPLEPDDLACAVEREGWGIVHNPDPADRLHLRVRPDRSGKSLGKFYNGTPVRVISQQGDWSQVAVGLDGLTGWMMTRYLAFGADADEVASAFPAMSYLEAYENQQPAYLDRQGSQQTELTAAFEIVGVDGEWYILLTHHGDIRYAPQAWFWAGNG